MSYQNFIITVMLLSWVVIIGWGIYQGRKLAQQQNEIEKKWEQFIKNREELYANMTNVDEIEKDMEKGARLREMIDAKRTTLPREDAGPPAVIHRPSPRVSKPWVPRKHP